MDTMTFLVAEQHRCHFRALRDIQRGIEVRFALSAAAAVSGLMLLGLAFYGQPAVYLHQVHEEWNALMDRPTADQVAEPDNDAAHDRAAQLQREVARLEQELAARRALEATRPDGPASAEPLPPVASLSPPAGSPGPLADVMPEAPPAAEPSPVPAAPPASETPGLPAIGSGPAAGPSSSVTLAAPTPLPAPQDVRPPAPADVPAPASPAPVAPLAGPAAPASPPPAATTVPAGPLPGAKSEERHPTPPRVAAAPSVPSVIVVPDRHEPSGDAVRAEASKPDGARTDIGKSELTRTDQGKTEQSKTEQGKAEPTRTAPAKQLAQRPVPPPPPLSQTPSPRQDVEDTQSILARLRQAIPGAVPIQQAEAPPVVEAKPRPAPAPSLGRLRGARAALANGRVEEARRLLQEAQLQLVFRPVDALGEDPPSAGRGAADVAHALEALSASDVQQSRQYIDIAIDDISGSGAQAPIQESSRRASGYAPAYPPR